MQNVSGTTLDPVRGFVTLKILSVAVTWQGVGLMCIVKSSRNDVNGLEKFLNLAPEQCLWVW